MRGQRTFQSLFPEIETISAPKEGKGRSAANDAKRNTFLLHRYYFYGMFTKMRYEVILKALHTETYLSESRIADVIAANSDELRAIRKAAPDLPTLRKRYPHLLWAPTK